MARNWASRHPLAPSLVVFKNAQSRDRTVNYAPAAQLQHKPVISTSMPVWRYPRGKATTDDRTLGKQVVCPQRVHWKWA
jgi:hypothetical protein